MFLLCEEARVRVVVSGIGLVTGLGPGREATWTALRAGVRGARWLEGTDFAGVPVPARRNEITDEPILNILRHATLEAMGDARLEPGDVDPRRVGCLIGLSKGGVRTLTKLHQTLRMCPNSPTLDPLAFLRGWPNAGAVAVSRLVDVRGPCLAPVAACATGLVAVLRGADLIRQGTCDMVLAGASDASLEPLILEAFRRMRTLARCPRDTDPADTVRPLDRQRSGFLVGEGAAVLVLERHDLAARRGVNLYATVAGGALGSDARHITDLDPDPTNLAGLITRALDSSGVEAAEIDHVNLHGTATRPNDPVECQAIRHAFGSHARSVGCSANKAQIGHLLGAAGAVELAITCLAIRDGFLPPTMNLSDPDPTCDLDATPQVGRTASIRAALKLSLGFGGHLAAAVLRQP